MKVGSLFSGIGGFDLGLVRAGMEIAWQVEIDDFCQKVLKKHAPEYWPNAKIYGDIKSVTKEELEPVELISGGFPCQPFSSAGKRRGKEDDRYLWPEMLRIIRELSPRWIIGENVAGFINMELENAFTDLEAEGYKVEAFVLPANAVELPHKRERVWIVAYSSKVYGGWGLFSSNSKEKERNRSKSKWSKDWQFPEVGTSTDRRLSEIREGWRVKSRVDRMSHGIPNRVDRLRSLGNAVVPQIPEILGRCILEIESVI